MLICFAMREEARFFVLPGGISPAAAILVTGVGEKNAARSLEKALARNVPKLVLTCGYAGGLNPELVPGALVFCADHASHLKAPLVELGGLPVRFHCAPRIAVSAAEKAALRASTGADAVEMESGIIDRICLDRQIHCGTVRVISDSGG